MAHKIQIKRGSKADLPVLNDGEMGLCIDTQEVFVGSNGTNIPVRYAHPTTAGNKHIPTGGASGQILRYSASGTAIWGADNDTITTVNGKTGAITKADITALGIPAQDTVVDISGKADTTYVDGKVKTDVPAGAKFTDTVYTHPASHPASMITGLPASLPASGGNADTVGGFTVGVNVPAGAKFTDTITTVNGKTGAITKADITALGVPAQDTVYTHPANHPPSIITQDASNRFVTDSEKTSWNSKAPGYTYGTTDLTAGSSSLATGTLYFVYE